MRFVLRSHWQRRPSACPSFQQLQSPNNILVHHCDPTCPLQIAALGPAVAVPNAREMMTCPPPRRIRPPVVSTNGVKKHNKQLTMHSYGLLAAHATSR
jgi:hypothetical protein